MTDAIDDRWPGADLVRAGPDDLRDGRESVEGLLGLVGAPGFGASASTCPPA